MPKSLFAAALTPDCYESCGEAVIDPTPVAARASLAVARAALGQMMSTSAVSPPRIPPVTMAMRASEAWAATEHVMRTVTQRAELTGQLLVAEGRKQNLIALEDAHALIALGDWVDRTRAPGSAAQMLTLAPTETERDIAKKAFDALSHAVASVAGGIVDEVPQVSNASPSPLWSRDALAQRADVPEQTVRDEMAIEPSLPSVSRHDVGDGSSAERSKAPDDQVRKDELWRGSSSVPNAAPAVLSADDDVTDSQTSSSMRGASTTVDVQPLQPKASYRTALIAAALIVVIGGGGAAWYLMRGRAGASSSSATEEGIAAYARGAREAATIALSNAVTQNPNDARAYTYLGRIARENGEFAKSREYLDKAITIAPDNALALREMGSALLADTQPDLARKFYIRALTINPGDHVSQGFLGCALTRLQRSAEAQPWFQRAGQGDWSSCATRTP